MFYNTLRSWHKLLEQWSVLQGSNRLPLYEINNTVFYGMRCIEKAFTPIKILCWILNVKPSSCQNWKTYTIFNQRWENQGLNLKRSLKVKNLVSIPTSVCFWKYCFLFHRVVQISLRASSWLLEAQLIKIVETEF